MKVILHDPKQAHEVLLNIWPEIKDALSNNRRLEMIIQDEKRTNDQNALFHAIIHQIAKEAEHMGARWDTESWKRFLVDQFSSEVFHKSGRVVPSLDNQRVVQLGLQTRDFSKKEATEFTEWLLAWAANAGIDVVLPET